MKKYLLLITTCIAIAFNAKSEAMAYPMDELFLNSNIIAHVKITSHTQQYFKVRVLELLYTHRSGIEEGDYLKIINDFSIVCPSALPIEYAQQKKEALAFLSFHNGKWYLNKGEIGFFTNGKIRIPFYKEGFYYTGTIPEWKKDLTDYFDHFRYNSEGELISKYSNKQLKGKTFSPLVALQYHYLYWNINKPFNPGPYLENIFVEPEEVVEYVEPQEEDEIHTFVEKQPIPDDTMSVVMEDLLNFIWAEYPHLLQLDLQGICYYSLIFEKDGSISKVEILRSIHSEIDQGIKAYYDIHSKWTPATINNGIPVRCKQTFPLRIN